MTVFWSIVGMVGCFFAIKYREMIGDTLGEAEWMKSVGGVYNLIVVAAVLVFLWCIAALTGTTDVLFAPLLLLFPGRSAGTAQF